MALKRLLLCLAALSLLAIDNPATAQQTAAEKPTEYKIARHMEFVRPAPTLTIGLGGGENSALFFDVHDPKTWDGAGFEARTTKGFPIPAAQTSEELYFRVTSIPAGYSPTRIDLRNIVDPRDNNDVEHTPRYQLWLYPDRLMGHVWLRRRGINATATGLTLDIAVYVVRNNLYDDRVKSGQLVPTPPGALVYYRNVDTCGRDHHLHIDYAPIVHVDESIKWPAQSDSFANRLYVPC